MCDIDKLSPMQRKQARNFRDQMLRAVNKRGASTKLAADLGVDKSQVTRWKESGKFDDIAAIIAALEFKLQPKGCHICPPGHIPLPIWLVLQVRGIVIGIIGKDSFIIRFSDKWLRKFRIIKRDSDKELTIRLEYFR